MYDWPETEQALNRLWYTIQRKLNSSEIIAPKFLERQVITAEKRRDLMLGQVCGWPLVNLYDKCYVPFAKIQYDIQDCDPGEYNSVYIGQSKKDIRFLESHSDLLEADKIAVNSEDSQSGFQVFSEITGLPAEVSIVESNRIITNSHRKSIESVALGKAQIAAVDTVSFELARKFDPEVVQNVSILGRSISRPAPPLVTATRFSGIIPALLEAIAFGVYNLSDEDKEILMIKGLLPARRTDYDVYLRAG